MACRFLLANLWFRQRAAQQLVQMDAVVQADLPLAEGVSHNPIQLWLYLSLQICNTHNRQISITGSVH